MSSPVKNKTLNEILDHITKTDGRVAAYGYLIGLLDHLAIENDLVESFLKKHLDKIKGKK